MSKKYKKFSTDAKTISDCIENDYVIGMELNESNKTIKNIQLLMDNDKATKISGTEFIYGTDVSLYKVACKFMQKYNKTLKKSRRKLDDYEVGGSNGIKINMHPELVKLSKYSLEEGTYYAQLDDDQYAILEVRAKEDEDGFTLNMSYSLYLIGSEWKKWKSKFYEMVDKYKQIKKDEKSERIYYTDGKPSSSARFKTFDKMVFEKKEYLIQYIDNFISHIPDYYNYGMTPKLSIMLYSSPGCGKSTTAKAIASYLNINNVTIVSPEYFSGDNESFSAASRYRRSPGRTGYEGMPTVYSIDDIDCICESRDDNKDKENLGSLANLLTFLDNPPTFDYKAKDGIYYPISIVVASTNYYDRLDSAVKRAGRFDLTIEMQYFDKKQAQLMCDIYNLKLEDIVKDCNKKDFMISPAELQAACLENIDKSMKDLNK